MGQGTQLGEAYIPIRATLEKLDRDLKSARGKVNSALGKVGGDFLSLGGTVNRALMGAVKAAAGALTAGAVGVGAVMVSTTQKAAEFQDQIALLGIAAKESGPGFDVLHDAALRVGGDASLVGVNATGAADSLTGLYKAGLTTGEIFGDLQGYLSGTADLSGALRAAVDTAAATELEMAEASDLAAITLATFGAELETEEERAQFIVEAMNNFVQSADASVAEVSDLAEALRNVGPAAAGFGFSLEETNNALAILSTRGITGAEAGTALKSMLTNIMRPTDQVTDALRALGVELYDQEGQMYDLRSIMGQFQEGLQGVTDEQRNQYIQTVAGTYGMNAMNTLLAEGVEGWDAMAVATSEASTIQEVAQTRASTLSGRMEALQGVLETLGIKVGEKFLPVATKLTDWASEMADEYGPAVEDIFETIGTAVGTLVDSLMAGKGPLASIRDMLSSVAPPEVVEQFDAIVEKAQEVATYIQEHSEAIIGFIAGIGVALAAAGIAAALAAIANPIGLIVLAVGALGAAWATDFGGIKTTLTEFWENTAKPVLEQLWEWLQVNVPIALEALRAWWVDTAWPAIQEAVATAWPVIEEIFNSIKTFIVETLIPTAQELYRKWVEEIWPAIQGKVEEVWPKIEEVFNSIKTFIVETLIPTAQELYAKWVEEIWPEIQTATENVWTILEEIFGEIGRWINDNIVPWIEFLHEKWVEEIWPAIQTAVETVWGIIEPIWESFRGWLEETLPVALEGLQGVFETVMEAIRTAVQPVKDLWDKFVDAVQGFWDWISSHTFKFHIKIPDIPDWALPGSPLPIHTAWKDFYREMDQMVVRPRVSLGGQFGERITLPLAGAAAGGGMRQVVIYGLTLEGVQNADGLLAELQALA